IHLAELLKLGIKVSQAMGDTCRGGPKSPPRPGVGFLHNHLTGIALIDMFVVAKPRTGKRNQIPVTAKSILFSSLQACDVHYMFHPANPIDSPNQSVMPDQIVITEKSSQA